MENMILQHAKGSAAVRFWIPSGQPKLRVSGKITDGHKTVLVAEKHQPKN